MSRVKLVKTAKAMVKENAQREYTEGQVDEMLTAFIDAIAKITKEGEPVTVRFFGTFKRRFLRTRRYADPNTGEIKTNLGKSVLKFKASEFFNRRIRIT